MTLGRELLGVAALAMLSSGCATILGIDDPEPRAATDAGEGAKDGAKGDATIADATSDAIAANDATSAGDASLDGGEAQDATLDADSGDAAVPTDSGASDAGDAADGSEPTCNAFSCPTALHCLDGITCCGAVRPPCPESCRGVGGICGSDQPQCCGSVTTCNPSTSRCCVMMAGQCMFDSDCCSFPPNEAVCDQFICVPKTH